MKKLTLSLLLAFALLPSFAQEKIDFFDFVRDFDWNMSESDFKAKYKDRIVTPEDASATLDRSYVLSGIYFNQYDTETAVRFDSQPKRTVVSLSFIDLEDSEHSKLKEILNQKIGDPTHILYNGMVLNKQDAEVLNIGLDYTRIWVVGAYNFLWYPKDENGQQYMSLIVERRAPDFRQGYWGDSMNDVKIKEGKPDEFDMEGIYSFTTHVAGLECLAGYRFTDGKLTSGKYVFLNLHADNCVRNYEQLVELLTTKYGEPISNDKKSTALDFERSVLDDGELVESGKMRFDASWTTPSTSVAIYLYGERYQIQLGIEYYSVLHQEEIEQDVLNDL